MRLGRVTKYALLLVPLFVCAARLHAQRTGSPSVILQEANRCLSLVRSGRRGLRRKRVRKRLVARTCRQRARGEQGESEAEREANSAGMVHSNVGVIGCCSATPRITYSIDRVARQVARLPCGSARLRRAGGTR